MTKDEYTLAILSRDAEAYKAAITPELPSNIRLISCAESTTKLEHSEQVDVLLAEPDLAADIVGKCSNLKWVQSTWAGVKPLLELGRVDFEITGVKDVFGPQMREYVLAYMLYFTRQIPLFISQQSERKWLQPTTQNLYDKTLGIMGVGSIGQSVAKAAKDLGMRVLGVSNSSRDCDSIDQYFATSELAHFASELDFLVCLLPHTTQTEGLVNASFLKALPDNCVIINAGRGQVIEEQALIDALRNKKIHAAVLDVFDREPLAEDHPYWSVPNMLITQHTAAVSQVKDIAEVFNNNCLRFVSGQPLAYKIDPSKGY